MAVEGTNAPQYIPVFDSNEETGIRDVLLRKTTSHASWYTLDGRKLQGHPTQKGLYITSNQFFKNSEGVMPKYFLNWRVKCWGYSKPRLSAVSEMVEP